jgi:hypothetical protein
MRAMLIIHYFIAIIFPILAMLFSKREMNYLAYSRFCMIIVITLAFYMIEKFLQMSGKGKIKQNVQMAVRYVLGILLLCFAFNLLTYLLDFTSIFITIVGYILLTIHFLCYIQYSHSKYKGIYDTVSILLIIPVFLSLSKVIMFAELDIPSLIEFTPLNFCFFSLYIADSAKEIQEEKEGLIKPDENSLSVAKLLGDQDRFHVIICLNFYIFLHILIEAYQKSTSM